ncbi:MAG: PH domain-containing protein [Gammaproteobacteria bacterium]|nr:PH domain-containing protein [Gammaproteobacteria bacterium]MCH9762714.1 PH domain-containing protein [Gammaproteobacteria bacterium]
MDNKQVVYQARLHWVLFIWPISFFILSAWLGLTFASFHEVSVLFMLIGLIWSVLTWLTYQFSSLTIKKKQIVLRTGILVRQTIDVPLSKIESIDIKQSIIGSLLKYGSLVITGTGGTRQSMGYVARPLTCRRHIEQLMYDV